MDVHAKSCLTPEPNGHSGQKPRARPQPARTGRGPSPAKCGQKPDRSSELPAIFGGTEVLPGDF